MKQTNMEGKKPQKIEGRKTWKHKLVDWKCEVGQVPENTCPNIDKALKEIEDWGKQTIYLKRVYRNLDEAKDLLDELPDIDFADTPSILEEMRKDNSQLRELGRFWYEKCQELVEELSMKENL